MTKHNTTRTTSADAELFQMIERCAALWRENFDIDDRLIAPLEQRLKSSVTEELYLRYIAAIGYCEYGAAIKVASEMPECASLLAEQITELHERSRNLTSETCALERQVAATRVSTPEGYAAKSKFLAEKDFEEDEQRVYAFLLGRDAARIGITELAPSCIKKHKIVVESYKGEAKRANYLIAKALRTYSAKRVAAI